MGNRNGLLSQIEFQSGLLSLGYPTKAMDETMQTRRKRLYFQLDGDEDGEMNAKEFASALSVDVLARAEKYALTGVLSVKAQAEFLRDSKLRKTWKGMKLRLYPTEGLPEKLICYSTLDNLREMGKIRSYGSRLRWNTASQCLAPSIYRAEVI